MRVFGRAGGDVGEGVEDGVGVGAEVLAGAGDGGVIGSQWSVVSGQWLVGASCGPLTAHGLRGHCPRLQGVGGGRWGQMPLVDGGGWSKNHC